jgi:hypothetical protein
MIFDALSKSPFQVLVFVGEAPNVTPSMDGGLVASLSRVPEVGQLGNLVIGWMNARARAGAPCSTSGIVAAQQIRAGQERSRFHWQFQRATSKQDLQVAGFRTAFKLSHPGFAEGLWFGLKEVGDSHARHRQLRRVQSSADGVGRLGGETSKYPHLAV